MQNPERLLFVPVLALIFCFCKNQNATPENKPVAETAATLKATADTTVFTSKRDTLVGFKGIDRCSYSRPSPGITEYYYQHYVVNTIDSKSEPTQAISITPTGSMDGFSVPTTIKGFFAGLTRDQLFIDIGTGPDGREILVFNLKTQKAGLKTKYVGEPEVLDNGKLWFLLPAEEKEITKLPECPDRAEWEKKGLRTGYGQVCMYDLANNSLIRKTEWRCVAMQ